MFSMKIVKKVEKIVNENHLKNIPYPQDIVVEKKPYDFWSVRTISENTNKPQNKNIDNSRKTCDFTSANVQYSIWY